MKTAMTRIFRNATLAMLAVLLLGSCAGDKDRLAGLPESFTTKIYDNGLKQFVLAYQKPAHSPDHESHSAMNGGASGKQHRNHSQKGLEAEMIKRLEIRIKETGYCRQGYILDKEFSTLSIGDLILKGECVEGATDADRVQFLNVD
jgi:hypothetical protein